MKATKAAEWKFGMSVGNVTAENFAAMAEGKVDVIEVSTTDDAYDALDWRSVRANSNEYGVGLWSIHLPFWSKTRKIDIAHMDAQTRRDTNAYLAELIKKAGDIGIPVAVIHPGLEPTADNERETRLNYSAESLAELAEVCAQSGMTLAVEDLPRTCLGNHSDDFKILLSGDERVRIVFDTNHLLIQKNVDFIRVLGEKIITLHVSDYDFLNERHWLPYEGKNHWVDIVTELEKVGYEGPWLYELGLKAPKTINRRDLTYADFRANYEACVNKRPAEILGTPNEEHLYDWIYFEKPFFEDM